jgi:serine/threonine-protein kinase
VGVSAPEEETPAEGAMRPLRPGTQLLDGRFEVRERIASGGMGEVYAAVQLSLNRRVALKVLHADLRATPGMAERFRREARLLSGIDHPAVVRVIDFGEADGAPVLVMDLVEGQTLEERLRAGPLSPGAALPLLRQLAEGLGAVHRHGIVHRDLKPQNVVLASSPDGPRARLLDFGIARLVQARPAEAGLTAVGLVLGTPEYVSPEQAVAGPLDARSDIYSFGVLAFRVLAGRLPFQGGTPSETVTQHLTLRPPSLLELVPQMASWRSLAAVVDRCLEKSAAQRYPDGVELAAALWAVKQQAVPDAPPQGTTLPFAVATTPTATLASSAPASAAPRGGTGTLPGRAQNLTLMLTDIKGFTARTSSQTLEENARMLEEHDALLLPLVREHGGKLVQKRGDALFATFRSPTDAVRCGMAMQDALWRRNQLGPEESALRVRIALHLGEVLLAPDQVVGEPAQVVAAVEGEAEAGDVVLTEAVRLAMNRAAADVEPRGALTLPDGSSLALYRCVTAPAGPPFAGRGDATPGTLANTLGLFLPGGRAGVQARARLLLARAQGVLWKLRIRAQATTSRQRKQAAAAAGVGVLVALGLLTWGLSDLRRAERLLDAGDARGTLALYAAQSASRQASPSWVGVRVRALHAVGRHDDEHAAVSRLALRDLDRPTLAALAEDYGRSGNARARELLGPVVRERTREMRAIAADGLGFSAWGALRLLDREKAMEGDDLVEPYRRFLGAESCTMKAAAAARLGALGARSAREDLERLAASPRAKAQGLFGDGDCGHTQAQAALRKLGPP